MGERNRDANCIFCKIIDKQIPSQPVSEDDKHIAIRDINPQAPTHILVIPKDHISNISEITDCNASGALFAAASKIARQESLQAGFRLVVNTGHDGGQTVDHLHIHLLGGRSMNWPPG